MENHVNTLAISRNNLSYKELIIQAKGLLSEESDRIANLSNLSALLMQYLEMHWVGFYLVRGEELILGPFQGPVACTRIKKGKGVCGFAWETDSTVYVEDVHKFPGHIACSPYSRSELVVPVRSNGAIIAVLDIDSEQLNGFSDDDRSGIEELIRAVEKYL